MVKTKAKVLKGWLTNLWTNSWWYLHHLDNLIMQDLSIESRCVLSGTFMTLCGVCMAKVLLVAIGFALDEIDIEYTAHALARFLRKF